MSFASDASTSAGLAVLMSSLPTRSPISLRLLDRSSPSAVGSLEYGMSLAGSRLGLGNGFKLGSLGGRDGLGVIVE